MYRTPAEIAAEAAAAARRAQVPCLHLLLCSVPSSCLLGQHIFNRLDTCCIDNSKVQMPKFLLQHVKEAAEAQRLKDQGPGRSATRGSSQAAQAADAGALPASVHNILTKLP